MINEKIFALILAFLVVGLTPTVAASKPKSGTKCKVAGLTQTADGKKYTCIKLGSSLYWSNGVKIAKSDPIPSESAGPSTTPVVTISPQPQNQGVPCGFGAKVPAAISNVKAVWNKENLVITYDWDFKNPNFNCPVTEIVVELSSEGEKVDSRSKRFGLIPSPGVTSQSITLSMEMISRMFGLFSTNLESICLWVLDKYSNKSESICANSMPKFRL